MQPSGVSPQMASRARQRRRRRIPRGAKPALDPGGGCAAPPRHSRRRRFGVRPRSHVRMAQHAHGAGFLRRALGCALCLCCACIRSPMCPVLSALMWMHWETHDAVGPGAEFRRVWARNERIGAAAAAGARWCAARCPLPAACFPSSRFLSTSPSAIRKHLSRSLSTHHAACTSRSLLIVQLGNTRDHHSPLHVSPPRAPHPHTSLLHRTPLHRRPAAVSELSAALSVPHRTTCLHRWPVPARPRMQRQVKPMASVLPCLPRSRPPQPLARHRRTSPQGCRRTPPRSSHRRIPPASPLAAELQLAGGRPRMQSSRRRRHRSSARRARTSSSRRSASS